MKKTTIATLLAALLLTGCAGRESLFAPSSTTASVPESSQPQTTEVIRPTAEAAHTAVAETDDTRLAVNFIRDFYEMLVYCDESALDLDEYFNDGELKQQMAQFKGALSEKTEWLDKECFDIDYIAAVSNKAADGVNLITVEYAYNFRYPNTPYDPETPDKGWSGAGLRAPLAVKDGKIVNLAVDDLFEPLAADENIPEVQIVLSHITNAQNGSFELDGIVYEQEDGVCALVIADGGFVSVLDQNNVGDELASAVESVYELECLGNTGQLEVGDTAFEDAIIYRSGEKLLLVGEVAAPEDFDKEQGRYCSAFLFASTDI